MVQSEHGVQVVECREFGSLDGLVVTTRPAQPCGPRQVRIAITAAGVNYVDGLFVQGRYQIKPPLPFVPGNEIAGVITEVGAEVDAEAAGAADASLGTRTADDGHRSMRVGDRVFANVGLGGFASEVVIDARRVLHTPAALSDGQAATFTQSYCTAWFALVNRAHAEAGAWVLVLGAGGGVGLAAVDVGRHLGLRVIAAASSPDKRAAATARGAIATIDTSLLGSGTGTGTAADGTPGPVDLKTSVRRLLADLAGSHGAGDGVDLVVDPVGGAAGEQALRILREDGQLLVIGFAGGGIPHLPANQILLRNRRVTGVDWGAWAMRDPSGNAAILRAVVEAVEQGSLHPVEPVAYPFDQAAVALADQLERRVTGKAVLVPPQGLEP